MVGFFPTPYPDELLYSVLARYYAWSANVSPKVALQELFGRTTAIATFDLPSQLENLVENLPFGSKHTVESLIRQHTLYPLYAPFLAPDRSKAVFDSMRGHFSGDIHTRTGIMASSVPQINFFRFCPVCLREDTERHGEPYWHRAHQIAGVLVCPIHQVRLQNSRVKIQGDNRHEFYAADAENCIFKPAIVNYTKATLDKLAFLAYDVSLILKQSFSPKSGDWFRKKYQSLLIDRGLATASGRVHQKELMNQFVNFYGNDFLQLVHSEIDFRNENNWLSSIVRKHRKVFHPIRHLLIIRFLVKDVATFFDDVKDDKPFGAGAWTCFNGASKHYLEKVITSVSVSYSHDAKKLIGTFSCFCGFVYSTGDVSIPYSDKLSFGKIKSFGKIWERKLKKLLGERRVSLRESARQLKVDTKTVIRHAERLKLIAVKQKDTGEIQSDSRESENNANENSRAIWLKARKDYPALSKTALRKKFPSDFIRLYRNDRKWLERNSPKRKQLIVENKRVNWAERDGLILISVQNTVRILQQQTPPVRITIGSVGKILGLRALLEKHLIKLPNTKAFLLSQIESVEQFQIRRIRWAAQELFARNSVVKEWEVMRFAGIKSSCSKTIRQTVENAVLEVDSDFRFIRKNAV